MNRPKYGLRAVGLCVMAALSLMAFGAVSAQAEVGSAWMVNGANITTNTLLPEVQVKEIESHSASLLFTTGGGTKVKILCEAAALNSAKLKAEGGLTEGTVKFSGCETYLNGSATASIPCTPHTGAENLIVKTNAGVGLITLVEGTPVTLIKPASGTVLANIELSEECAIGENVPVEGELTLKDCLGKFAVEELEHLIEEGPGTKLTALKQPATLDGSAFVKLAGEHAGLKFSGLPK